MAHTILPYDPEVHTELLDTWLDADARKYTGIENGAGWNGDIAYWKNESPDTFQAFLLGDPEPAAAVYCFLEPDRLHIGEILVDPDKRGNGLGTAVLKFLLYSYAQCETATAVIFPSNFPSRRAFAKAGFCHTSTNPDGDAEYWTFHRMKITTASCGHLEPEMYPYRFVVIFARYKEQWLYARHRDRRTWETAGGHIEPGETTLSAAKRELYEETGAKRFRIRPMFDYHADNRAAKAGDHAAGQVFLAEIEELGTLPDYEMAETGLWETYPDELTYPAILPELFREMQKYI